MINRLKQPPAIRLSEEICRALYDAYLRKTADYFTLPQFEERLPGKIEGILGSVSQSFNGEYLFPTIQNCAAAYFVKISTQHPFRDGNKRMSVYLTDIFLSLNDVELKMGWKEMYELAKFIVDKKEAGKSHELLESFVARVFEENV